GLKLFAQRSCWFRSPRQNGGHLRHRQDREGNSRDSPWIRNESAGLRSVSLPGLGQKGRSRLHRRENAGVRVGGDLAASAAPPRNLPYHSARYDRANETRYDLDQRQPWRANRDEGADRGVEV